MATLTSQPHSSLSWSQGCCCCKGASANTLVVTSNPMQKTSVFGLGIKKNQLAGYVQSNLFLQYLYHASIIPCILLFTYSSGLYEINLITFIQSTQTTQCCWEFFINDSKKIQLIQLNPKRYHIILLRTGTQNLPQIRNPQVDGFSMEISDSYRSMISTKGLCLFNFVKKKFHADAITKPHKQ